MKNNIEKYSAFFGRSASIIKEPIKNNNIYSYQFSPIKVNFFRRIFTQLSNKVVTITDGFSKHTMNVPKNEQNIYPANIELIAISDGYITGAKDNSDILTGLLQTIATLIIEEDIFIGPLHTLDLNEKICQNSAMSALFFSLPEIIEIDRLCSCTYNAKLIVSVMPIYNSELIYAKKNGAEKLIELFENNETPNIFNPFRKNVI